MSILCILTDCFQILPNPEEISNRTLPLTVAPNSPFLLLPCKDHLPQTLNKKVIVHWQRRCLCHRTCYESLGNRYNPSHLWHALLIQAQPALFKHVSLTHQGQTAGK